MSTSVFCIAKTNEQASTIVTRLNAVGIPLEDISVLMPDKSGKRDFVHEKNTKAPEGAATGAGAGSLLGGTLGLLAGIGALAIPGVGPLIAAGPILATLSGAAVGAAVGGVGGALIGLGIPEYVAKRYEGKVAGGNVLISVHSKDSDDERRITEILEECQADDIESSAEAHADMEVDKDR